MPVPTNEDRAERGRAILEEYGKLAGEPDEDTPTLLADLLADLRHLAREEGVDFGKSSDMSKIHFNEEVEEEGGDEDHEDDDEGVD